MAGYVEDPDFPSDPNFDWGGGTATDGGPAAVSDALDFVIPSYESGIDVQALEDEQAQKEREWQEKRFQTAPVGTHLFGIVEFLKPPELVIKQGYANGRPVQYEAYKVTVKFAVVGRPNCTILEYMELPPAGKDKVEIYQNFMKKSDGKVAGWFARKFEHFLKSIGYPVVVGAPYPKEALAIKNWIGKQVHAEVEKGDDTNVRTNPETGMPYPVNNQFKSFKFRQAESTIVNAVYAGDGRENGGQRPASPAQGPARAGQPTRQAEPVGTHADRFVRAGLNNV